LDAGGVDFLVGVVDLAGEVVLVGVFWVVADGWGVACCVDVVEPGSGVFGGFVVGGVAVAPAVVLILFVCFCGEALPPGFGVAAVLVSVGLGRFGDGWSEGDRVGFAVVVALPRLAVERGFAGGAESNSPV